MIGRSYPFRSTAETRASKRHANVQDDHVRADLGSTSDSKSKTAMPLRIAIAGLGLVGLRHAKVMSHVDGVILCAVADPSKESTDQAEAYKVPHFDTLEELIEAIQPDGIILATPTKLHAPMMILFSDLIMLVEAPDDSTGQATPVKDKSNNEVNLLPPLCYQDEIEIDQMLVQDTASQSTLDIGLNPAPKLVIGGQQGLGGASSWDITFGIPFTVPCSFVFSEFLHFCRE